MDERAASAGRTRRRLRVFPASDRAFEQDVSAAVADSPTAANEPELVAHVTSVLRETYRAATIHVQDSLALVDAMTPRIWYVYRDGNPQRATASVARLHDVLADASRTTRASKELLSRVEKLAEDNGRAGLADRRAPRRRSPEGATAVPVAAPQRLVAIAIENESDIKVGGR
jgi:hypothetical protein